MNNVSFLIWHSACVTHVGKVRKVNQDACLDLAELGLWVVADGMGGHDAGEIASRMIVEQCQNINEPLDLNSFIADVEHRLIEVNQGLRVMSGQKFNNATIGSTVVALLIHNKQCAYLWVGDSRIYRLRNNQLQQMTRDHSMVEKYVADGVMSFEEANNSNMANALTRAVGGEDTLDVEVKLDEIQNGDIFLLCSDGLYREVSENKMLEIMSSGSDSITMTNNLLTNALNNTAKDNVTVSVIQIKEAYL